MTPLPYRKYLLHRLVCGDDGDEIVDNLRALEYIPPPRAELDEMVEIYSRPSARRAVLAKGDLNFFSEEVMDDVYWLVETPVARTVAERMLLDRVHSQGIAAVVGLKYAGRILPTTVVDRFRDGFWDTVSLTPVDFAVYMTRGGVKRPPSPPSTIAVEDRPFYAAWKHGAKIGDGVLDPKSIVRDIQLDAYWTFKELRAVNDHRLAMDYAKLALKTTSASRSLAAVNGGKKPADMSLLALIDGVDDTAPDLGQIHCDYSQGQSGTGDVSAAVGIDVDDKNLGVGRA